MSKSWHVNPLHPYFLYDPSNGAEFFDNIEERDKAAADCIAEYLDGDGWGEEVEGIFVGTVTGMAQEFNVSKRPDDLDAEGCDGEGIYWGDFDKMCQYRIEPVADPKDAKIERLKSLVNYWHKACLDAQEHRDLASTLRQSAEDELALCRSKIELLRITLEKYRGQVDCYGTESASAALAEPST